MLLTDEVRAMASAATKEDVLRTSSTVLQALDDDQDPASQLLVISLLFARWQAFEAADDFAAADQTISEILERSWNIPEPALSERKAGALAAQASSLRARGDVAAALQMFKRVVERYDQVGTPATETITARALAEIANCEDRLEKSLDVRPAREELIRRFATADGISQRALVAGAIVKHAGSLYVKDPQRALSFLDLLSDRLLAAVPEARARLEAVALGLRLEIFMTRRDLREVFSVASALSRRLAPSGPRDEMLQYGKLALQAADLLRTSEQFKEALTLDNAVEHGFMSADDHMLRVMSVRGLINAVRDLVALGRIAEATHVAETLFDRGDAALEALDQIAQRQSLSPDSDEWRAWALAARAEILRVSGRTDEATEAVQDVATIADGSPSALIRLMREITSGSSH